MHSKNAKRTARAGRYMLSADPKLQRISLRKVAVRGAHTRKPRLPRSKTPRPAEGEPAAPWETNTWVFVAVAACVVAAAVIIAVRQPSRRSDLETLEAPPPRPIAEPAVAAAGPIAAPPLPGTKRTGTLRPTPSVTTGTRVPAASPVVAAPTSEPPAPPVPGPPARTPVVPVAADSQRPASVTITGCLEFEGDAFRLKDTVGDDAPKSRSWKSGFLRKRTSALDIVDSGNTLKLPTYVGQRIAATGTLESHALQVHALQRVAVSCS